MPVFCDEQTGGGGGGSGDLVSTNNLSDVASAATALANLGGASTAYVNGLAVNLGKRQRVRAATTANITIATALNNGDTLDGVTLATDDLVLVKNQSSPAQNGVYVVGASPARASEFDSYNEHPGSLIAVEEGTTNADTVWLCTSNDGGTLDTTAIAFSQMSVSGTLLAANNLSDVVSASAARSNLGLAIGSNVQAFSSVLSTLAGAAANGQSLVTAANYAAMRTLLSLVPGTDVVAPSSSWVKVGSTTLGADATQIDSVTLDCDTEKFHRITGRLTHASTTTDGRNITLLVNGAATNITNNLNYLVGGSPGQLVAFGRFERSAEAEFVMYVHSATGQRRVFNATWNVWDKFGGGGYRNFQSIASALYDDTSTNITQISLLISVASMFKAGSTILVEKYVGV